MGIFGKTGSGKSTILSLITRIYDVSKGNILLNNRPIHKYDLKSLRKNLDMYLKMDTYFLVQLKKIFLTAQVKLIERN